MPASSCPVTPAQEQSKSNSDQEKSSPSPGRKKFLGRVARGKSSSSMLSHKQKSKHSKKQAFQDLKAAKYGAITMHDMDRTQ